MQQSDTEFMLVLNTCTFKYMCTRVQKMLQAMSTVEKFSITFGEYSSF